MELLLGYETPDGINCDALNFPIVQIYAGHISQLNLIVWAVWNGRRYKWRAGCIYHVMQGTSFPPTIDHTRTV